jgi:hypothetical protein
MKPTMPTIENEGSRPNSRRLPVTDFNYHTSNLGSYNGRCVRIAAPSFRSISSDYFNTEARHYFFAEAFVFAAIMVTAAVPLVRGAQAILGLIRALGGV